MTVRVRGMAAEDGAGNRSTVSAAHVCDSYRHDRTDSDNHWSSIWMIRMRLTMRLTLTITFSEDVTDFATEDLMVATPSVGDGGGIGGDE